MATETLPFLKFAKLVLLRVILSHQTQYLAFLVFSLDLGCQDTQDYGIFQPNCS